jgi:hypothetical protein
MRPLLARISNFIGIELRTKKTIPSDIKGQLDPVHPTHTQEGGGVGLVPRTIKAR